MEAQWVADRLRLPTLLTTQPDWTVAHLAAAIGRSAGWVRTWQKRLRTAVPHDMSVVRSQSRARKTPPTPLSEHVVQRMLAIRDQPPNHLGRVPGPKAIRS